MLRNNRKDEAYRCPKEPNSKYFYLCKKDHDKRCKRCKKSKNFVEVFIDGEKVWESQRKDDFTHITLKVGGVVLSYEE